MTFINPISSLPVNGMGQGFNLPGAFPLAASSGTSGTSATSAASAATDGTFGNMLTQKIGELDSLNKTSDSLAVKAVTGDLTDIHQYTIAANEAAVATQLTVAVRNKAVEAFNEIMRMPM